MSRKALKAINWSGIAERISEADKNIFSAFKSKSDQYLRRVQEYPETAPKIDWNLYEKLVPIPGMVSTFKKNYESISVPYPKDTYTAQIEAQEKEAAEAVRKFCEESNQRIVKYQSEIERIKGLLPFAEMTMEDFRDTYPDLALDALNNPTVWPHNPEDQIDEKKESH